MLATHLGRLRHLGYEVKAGVEAEFVLYKDGPDGRAPAWPANLDYALQHPPEISDFFHDLGAALTDAAIGYEAFKTEGAPGQCEVTFAYGDALAAVDHYTVFRHITAQVAGRYGMTPVFMAAPETGVGSGLHLHLSLWREHAPAFAHRRGQQPPPAMAQAIAGLISALPHLAPLYAPTINSYKRYQPHSFAPTRFNWGHDHRGCAVRACGHSAGAHLEVRLAGADANAYLTLAAYTAAITHGIEEQLTPRPACDGDAYQDQGSIPLYRDLAEALAYFANSTIAHLLIGEDVVRHYAQAARAELTWHRRHVTDTERQRGIR